MNKTFSRESYESLELPDCPPRQSREENLEILATTSEVTNDPVDITPPIMSDSLMSPENGAPILPDEFSAVQDVGGCADCEEMRQKCVGASPFL